MRAGREDSVLGAPAAVRAGGECVGRWDLLLGGMAAGTRSKEDRVGEPRVPWGLLIRNEHSGAWEA